MVLDVELAEKIIDKLADCTDYNVNIMNDKGIIVASKDKSRVGTFHEVALEIVQKKLDYKEVEAEDTFLGAKPGINMPLEYKKTIIGVLGLTGSFQNGQTDVRGGEIRSVAMVIKRMMETMLEYEYSRQETTRRKNDKERFINCLLYEDMSKKELQSMAGALGYSDGMRIPVSISLPGDSPEVRETAERLTRGSGGRDDIFVTDRAGKILIFKSYSEPLKGFFENYKFFMGEYLGRFLRYVAENNVPCKICVGSVQDSMVNYKYGYQHCLWLEKEIDSPKHSIFFYDYLDEYLKQQLPFLELHKVFEVFAKQYSESFKKLYIEHIGALNENNYSMQESSKCLYIHKNTLAFRLDKIKSQLGLNPIQNARDRELVNYLLYYLKEIS